MRKTKRSGNFFLSLLFNMLLNPEGAVVAAVLLGLHFWLGISLWWTFLALGLWLAGLILWMLFIGWARDCGDEPDPVRENKNPYSSKKYPK